MNKRILALAAAAVILAAFVHGRPGHSGRQGARPGERHEDPDDPQAGRAARRLPHLLQGRLDQRAAGHHRQRPRPRAPDVQGHRGHGRHRLRQGIRDRPPGSTSSWAGSTGRSTGRPTATRPGSPAWQKEVDELVKAQKAVHHQGRPLDAVHEERRHRAQRLDQPGDDGLLRHPAVEQDRAPDAAWSPTG
ncbi:MAG: hypothetical protein MZU79_05440 [Anaerotruncus sp.]|nr:hypothetical protein [Anaerotruncus sp.]